MVQVNFAERALVFKIVYIGPPKSGKWTTLLQLQRCYPKKRLQNCATPSFHTIDGIDLGRPAILKMKTRFQLYIRRRSEEDVSHTNWYILLKNVDGIIFVADSQKSRFEDNLSAFHKLILLLQEEEFHQDIQDLPFVWQWNKCDLSERMTSEELNQQLNILHAPSFEAIATEGKGVVEALKAIISLIEKKRGAHYLLPPPENAKEKILETREQEILRYTNLRRSGASEREVWKFLLKSTSLLLEMKEWYSVQKLREEVLGSFLDSSRALSGEDLFLVLLDQLQNSEEIELRKALWAYQQLEGEVLNQFNLFLAHKGISSNLIKNEEKRGSQ
ncbi:MAG: GTPase domain-containing protein [Planctomycetota bacterium]